jgi:hypothetical protein
MSNNKFQKFVKKLFYIEDEIPKYKAGRPMDDAERKVYNSPEQVELRRLCIEEGCVIFEHIES